VAVLRDDQMLAGHPREGNGSLQLLAMSTPGIKSDPLRTSGPLSESRLIPLLHQAPSYSVAVADFSGARIAIATSWKHSLPTTQPSCPQTADDCRIPGPCRLFFNNTLFDPSSLGGHDPLIRTPFWRHHLTYMILRSIPSLTLPRRNAP
jgi:hypothetical protein